MPHKYLCLFTPLTCFDFVLLLAVAPDRNVENTQTQPNNNIDSVVTKVKWMTVVYRYRRLRRIDYL